MGKCNTCKNEGSVYMDPCTPCCKKENFKQHKINNKNNKCIDYEKEYIYLIGVKRMNKIIELVNKQAEDEGLWFNAITAPEAYLQQELRKLHE